MKTSIQILFCVTMFFVHSCKQTATHAGYEAIHVHSKKIQNTWHWQLSGLGGLFGEKIELFNLDYDATQEVDLKEARCLLILAVEDFLNSINNTQSINSLLIETPFPSKRLNFGLAFMQPNGTFVANPHIAYAHLVNGRIAYSIDTPLRLEHVHEETYEEALEIIKQENALHQSAETSQTHE